MGISHRRLKGWEPREVTDVFEDGKLIRRTVTRREPEFTPRELNKLLASVELERDLNPHGIPYAEAIDPANIPISKPKSSAMRAEIGSNTEPGCTH